jgi:hypothetical protein
VGYFSTAAVDVLNKICLIAKTFKIPAYDISGQLSADQFERQQNFLIDQIFDEKWTRYENLTLMGYSGTAVLVNSKKFENQKDIRQFIKKHGQVSLMNENAVNFVEFI